MHKITSYEDALKKDKKIESDDKWDLATSNKSLKKN